MGTWEHTFWETWDKIHLFFFEFEWIRGFLRNCLWLLVPTLCSPVTALQSWICLHVHCSTCCVFCCWHSDQPSFHGFIMEFAATAPFKTHDRVRIRGLVSRPELNGADGGRVKITSMPSGQLREARSSSVKEANCELLLDSDPSSRTDWTCIGVSTTQSICIRQLIQLQQHTTLAEIDKCDEFVSAVRLFQGKGAEIPIVQLDQSIFDMIAINTTLHW
jgi:hypothetical protein